MYSHNVVIRLHHTDSAGIVFFGHVFTLAHECYEAFLGEHLPLESIIDSTDFLMPMVHASADYHKPMRLGDKLAIEMTLAKRGNSSFEFTYDFTNERGELCVVVTATHVVTDKATFKSRPIPESVGKALAALE